jgi:hypothetical protein
VSFASPHARSFGAQFLALVRRQARMYSRNIPMNVGRIAAIVFLCTLFGTIYFNLAARAGDFQGMRTLVAAIFMTAAFSAMLNMDASLPTLISSRSSFYRENAALMYNSGAYVLANFVVEIPWLAVIVLSGTSIGYFMIGLTPSASVFFTHYLATFTLALVLVSFGQSVAATMPSFDTAQAVVGILAPSEWLPAGGGAPRFRLPRAPPPAPAPTPPPTHTHASPPRSPVSLWRPLLKALQHAPGLEMVKHHRPHCASAPRPQQARRLLAARAPLSRPTRAPSTRTFPRPMLSARSSRCTFTARARGAPPSRC